MLLTAGTRLGPYEIAGAIGAGGMGEVYRAKDSRLDRHVAIKVMHAEGGDDTMAERLFREAKAAARAEHPAVITTYGYGTDTDLGVNYVVIERLQGEQQGVGAGTAADPVRDAAVLGHLLLERRDLRPQDDLPRGEHALEARLDLRLQLPILGLQIAEGNAARRHR